MMQVKRFTVVIVALSVMVFALGGVMAASAQSAPGPSSLVVVQQTPASGSAPPTLQYQVVTPTPGTGSLVIVQQAPAASGVSIPQYILVIPGSNPAQNTAVSVGQQLSTTRESTVTIYKVPTV